MTNGTFILAIFTFRQTTLGLSNNTRYISLNAIHKTTLRTYAHRYTHTHTTQNSQPKFITFWFVCFVWFHPHINICCVLLHFRFVCACVCVCLPCFLFSFCVVCSAIDGANIDYDNKFLNRFASKSVYSLRLKNREKPTEKKISNYSLEVFFPLWRFRCRLMSSR